MATYVRITVLVWADILAAYAMWVMMTYLTNVWELSITHAAGIINIWWGIASILPIGFAFLVDTFMGDCKMLLISSIAYSVGLAFLYLSTPPVLSKCTGTCSGYRPECIGDTQKTLFYAALALIAVGVSGHSVSLKSFLERQMQNSTARTENDRDSDRKVPFQITGIFGVVLVPIVGGFALPYIKPWSIRFGIPAICTLVATLLFSSGSFLCGSYSDEPDQPQGSPLTTALRVFAASVYKIRDQLPSDANQLYKKDDHEDKSTLSHTRGLSCLDKAAIILGNQTLEEQERNRWKLCSVTEVEETKIGIRIIPMWVTFIVIGTVSSIGNTYFLEQANHMDRKVGSLKVPLPILLIFSDISKSVFVKLYSRFRNWSKEFAPPTGIALAMIFSILSCIAAAKVETRRLDVIRRHGLLDKPEERIPMTIFCLVPQFLLLGALDGIAKHSIKHFFEDQAPPSMTNYLEFFTEGVLGLGIMGSVLSVHVVGKVSERGGRRPNWFQKTLNKSRLDNYYWTLAGLSAVNLVIYILVACFYNYRESATVGKEEFPEVDGSNPPFEENSHGCCCCC